jgi:serine/threonine protein kinase/tetratricopeptide (TPR) repeat protein
MVMHGDDKQPDTPDVEGHRPADGEGAPTGQEDQTIRTPDVVGANEPTVRSEAGTGGFQTGEMFQTVEAPERIGPYDIIRPLGEGGFGIVYLARQSKPVRRQVAVKVIKPGMDTASVIARFEAERQALAILDHVGVAKVFDAGTTERGLPYFVMEFVKGVPITVHCDRHKIDVEGRVRLMMQVCDAVLHAHQKGIVHRDLKPNNILVEYDGSQATVKVIDFGIAKSLNQPLTEKTIFTREGQMIGTPEYMSPEQAEMSSQDVDTRSDIYSIGVILYQLLTGSLPFDAESLRSAGFAEIVRIIREDDPPRPSTKFMTSMGSEEDRTSACAAARASDPRSLSRSLRGELDWIVMKCLEKERSRRYDTTGALLADLHRYLSDQPVEAGPPSVTYRARKFARRHRGPIAAAIVVLLTLIAGVVVSTGFAVSEARQRRIAVMERDAKSELLAVQTEHAVDLSTLIGTLIQRVDALDEATALAAMRIEHLDRLLQTAQQDDDELRLQLAEAYLELGKAKWTNRNPSSNDWPEAEQALGQAESLLDALERRGVHGDRSHRARAWIAFVRGDHHRLVSRGRDYEAAEAEYRTALASTRQAVELGPDHVDNRAMQAMALTNLGKVHAKRDEDQAAYDYYDQSRAICEEVAEAAPDSMAYQRDLAVVLNLNANAAGALGDVDAQRDMLERSLAIRMTLLESAPGQNRQMRDVAWGHYYMSRRLFRDGSIDAARRHAIEFLALIEQLAWSNPSDTRAAGSDLRHGHGFIATMSEYGHGPDQLIELYERFNDRLIEPRVSYDAGDVAARRLLLENLEARIALHESLGEAENAESLCLEAIRICRETPVDDVASVDPLCTRLGNRCALDRRSGELRP